MAPSEVPPASRILEALVLPRGALRPVNLEDILVDSPDGMSRQVTWLSRRLVAIRASTWAPSRQTPDRFTFEIFSRRPIIRELLYWTWLAAGPQVILD